MVLLYRKKRGKQPLSQKVHRRFIFADKKRLPDHREAFLEIKP